MTPRGDADAPAELMALFSASRAERQRQGLSLDDASARSGIERAFLSKIETGTMPNPTVATVRT